MLKQFSSNTRKLNRVVPKVNINNLTNNDLTGSLQNIEIPSNTKFQSKTRSNPNPIKLVNNKTTYQPRYYELIILICKLVKYIKIVVMVTKLNGNNRHFSEA